jgi:DNA polymerase-3 subunit alpha
MSELQEFIAEFEPISIPIHGVRLPEFHIEPKHKTKLGVDKDISNSDFLRMLCVKGFQNLKLKKDSKEYKAYGERIKHELNIFNELGFVDYILLVWDVINFCNENDIPTGFGRGSAAGSLVLYLIGVTKIDPIRYGLYFERFVSKIRAKKQVIDGITYLDGSLMCDVDMDICFYNRDKVIKYLEEKFAGKTSKILTLNTLSAKLLIKEVGKLAGSKSEEEMSTITSMIPKLHGIVEDLDKAYDTVPEFKAWCDENTHIYNIALKLKDLIKNKGVHPSGIMVSFGPLEEMCPTEFSSDKESVSSYDMNWVSLFTVKLDALGLRSVSVVDDVCKQLGIKMVDIDFNDLSIYRNLQNLLYPHGLFQIEADLAFRTTQKVKPKNIAELSAVLALARPGAMQFIDKFALYTNTGTYEAIHPFFDDILKETGGVAIYQEQLMQMAHKIGFTLDEAEILRRIVGKKKVEEVKVWQKKIEDKVKEHKLDPEISTVLWRILEDSASYSFNKSHSVAYAALAAATIYLKFNHPTEFYLSLLRMTKHEPDSIGEISKIHKEIQHFGLELLPPSLTHSKVDFSVENKNIRFGLSSIKGISEKTIEKLNNFKREHANKFQLFEASKEAGLGIGILSALIQAGTLKKFGNDRSFLVYEAQLWNKLTDREKQEILKYADKYEYKLVDVVRALNTEIKDEKNKPFIKDTRIATIGRHTEKYKEIYNQNKVSQDFANWWYEKQLLGYVYETRLIDIFINKLRSLDTIHNITHQYGANETCDFIGLVDEDATVGTTKTKSKSRYAKYSISDESGSIKVLIFNKSLEECKTLNGTYPKEGDIVIVRGIKKGDDAVFANTIAKQLNQIYTKLIDLKETTL